MNTKTRKRYSNPLGAFLNRHTKTDSGCWEWTGAVTTNGYSSIRYNSKTHYAHRFIYELLNGEIPEGHDIHHTCTNRKCVNPDHLKAVTRKEHKLETIRLRLAAVQQQLDAA